MKYYAHFKPNLKTWTYLDLSYFLATTHPSVGLLEAVLTPCLLRVPQFLALHGSLV